MSQDSLLYDHDEPGFIIAWRMKYQFATGRLEGEMTYGAALAKCAELNAGDAEKTHWPQRVSSSAESYGKFHAAH